MIEVTTSMQAEEAVIETRNYLDHILYAIADPVFVENEHHRRELGNDA
ncbi:MAG: hypothetical protein WCF90_08720 [Methanomicrobiales archaeon]